MRFGCVHERAVPSRPHGAQPALGVGIPVDVQLIWPIAGRGRPRHRHIPDVLSKVAAEDMLANAKWHTITWRIGTRMRPGSLAKTLSL